MVLTRNMSYLKSWPSFLLSKEYETWDKSMRNCQKQLANKRNMRPIRLSAEYISKSRSRSLLQRAHDNQPWVIDLLPSLLPSNEYETWDNSMSNTQTQLVDKCDRPPTKLNIECSFKRRKNLLDGANKDYIEMSKNQPWVVDLLQSVEGLPISVSLSLSWFLFDIIHLFPLFYKSLIIEQ